MESAPAPPRTAAWEWAQVAILSLNLGWTTLCLGGYRPETVIVTSALNALLLIVHLLARAFERVPQAQWHPAGWLLVPFLGYALANVLWVTPECWLGWRDWLEWAQLIAVFWVVLNGVRSARARGAVFGVLLALGFVAVVLACYQRFVRPDWLMLGRIQAAQFHGRASGPFGIPNSLAAFLMLLLPVTGALTVRRGSSVERRVLCGFLTVVYALGLVLTVSRGAWIAFALVLASAPLFAGRRPWRRRWRGAVLGIAAMAAIGLALYATVPVVRERFTLLRTESGERTRPIMWRGAWEIFRAHPWCGGGAGSFNDLFEAYRPENYQDGPRWAHNDYLNTLSDYGAVGFALFFGGCAAIVCRAARSRSRAVRPTTDSRFGVLAPGDPRPAARESFPVAAMTAGIAAFALQLFVDFHFKIPALAMAFATVGALVVQRVWSGPAAAAAARTQLRRLASVFAALALAFATAVWVVPLYRGETLRYAARQSIDEAARSHATPAAMSAVVARARAKLEQAVQIAPANGEAWADFAYTIALRAYYEPARARQFGFEAEAAADRALGLSPVPPEFWVRRGVALDLQGRWTEAGDMFVRALQLAPARGEMWYYQACHLSLDRTDPGRADAAVELCLRLDPGNAEALELQRRLAKNRRGP